MAALRVEADENASKVEELKAKVKQLEQENLSKEQEVTSLTHKNQVLETEVEKLEAGIKDAKALADESSGHSSQNESLQRKLQLLEEEAEKADKEMRETNEKYVLSIGSRSLTHRLIRHTGYARPMSRLVTTSAKYRHLKLHETNGRPSTKRWLRSTTRPRRNWTTLLPKLATSKHVHVERCISERCMNVFGQPAITRYQDLLVIL